MREGQAKSKKTSRKKAKSYLKDSDYTRLVGGIFVLKDCINYLFVMPSYLMVSDTIEPLLHNHISHQTVTYQKISYALDDFLRCYFSYADLAQNLLDQDVLRLSPSVKMKMRSFLIVGQSLSQKYSLQNWSKISVLDFVTSYSFDRGWIQRQRFLRALTYFFSPHILQADSPGRDLSMQCFSVLLSWLVDPKKTHSDITSFIFDIHNGVKEKRLLCVPDITNEGSHQLQRNMEDFNSDDSSSFESSLEFHEELASAGLYSLRIEERTIYSKKPSPNLVSDVDGVYQLAKSYP